MQVGAQWNLCEPRIAQARAGQGNDPKGINHAGGQQMPDGDDVLISDMPNLLPSAWPIEMRNVRSQPSRRVRTGKPDNLQLLAVFTQCRAIRLAEKDRPLSQKSKS